MSRIPCSIALVSRHEPEQKGQKGRKPTPCEAGDTLDTIEASPEAALMIPDIPDDEAIEGEVETEPDDDLDYQDWPGIDALAEPDSLAWSEPDW